MAAAQAQKAADLILNRKAGEEVEEGEDISALTNNRNLISPLIVLRSKENAEVLLKAISMVEFFHKRTS